MSFSSYLHHQFFNRRRLRALTYKIPAQQQAVNVSSNSSSSLLIMQVLFLLFSILMLPLTLSAQQDSTDPRRVKPVEQLERLKPFLGKFSLTMQQSNRTLTGTIIAEPVVKGWYIERVITSKIEDGSIDSEIRSLITWDATLGKYRIWRFVPLTPQAKHDGVGWFEGNTFIEEYEFEPSKGFSNFLRNRITMITDNEMKIVNEVRSASGVTSTRGIITAKRLL